ncbi:arsenate reductase (glutaredoxin) [Vibrio mediterranei]|jgi:arsenate reductase|uniref:Arsenate reductase n=1 Tax=Vibrio mediterranei TaxID=689 RepID=A0ABX5D4K4_9VIBR|nr:arsenate reductase (glutaredoxin) [Vibrio mediterranei]MCG9656046.1 arsenate reductase (glutaredoxin) [Vibrio mediterranei]MCG9665746.1 arsenate reductase (glutaredoxin) [Vibrio mediterranei]MCG9790152.1 arsenate reductase (glutaredoxin) [Vibrio mediterranei]PCD87313.1 arsenate reductase (glutaredoxin) [Vibrio mediterranei]PRQ64614.1 arsenate reductase (glutaredoxin) [Vibrio mediterranei]
MSVTIFHNPRCSKSRQTLALLEEKGIQPEVVKYLDTPPTVEKLKEIFGQLELESVRAMMRTKEDIYKELNLADPALTDDHLFQAMFDNPKLIERPIVINNGKAKHGRPPEQVLDIL